MHTDTPAAITPKQRTRRRWWLTLPVLCIPVLVVQLDTAIVNLAVQPIRQAFGANTTALQWVIDGYNILYAVLLLTGGQLADLYGRRRLLMLGIALFTAASLLCAAAPTIAVLIVARGLAGIAAGLLLPATLAIIRVVWDDPDERGRVLGIWAACNGLALAIGPPLGGVLVNLFGWRSIFLAVVPLAASALILAPRAMPESSDARGRRLDVRGQILGMLVLGGIAVAAIEAHHLPFVAVTALVVALSALSLFIRSQASQGDAALVPMVMFRMPRFWRAMVATAGMTFGMYGVLFLLPLTWQASGRFDALGAGLALLPMALVFVVTSPLSGRLATCFGARAMTGGGVAIIATGLFVIGASATPARFVATEIGCALTGLGMGLATGPLMGVAVGAVNAQRSGTAAALANVARMIGATLGVAILGTVFALARDASQGLQQAMLLGAVVQFAAAILAWTTPAAGDRQ